MRELFTIILQFRESTVGSTFSLSAQASSDRLGHRTTSIIIACRNLLVGMLNVTKIG